MPDYSTCYRGCYEEASVGSMLLTTTLQHDMLRENYRVCYCLRSARPIESLHSRTLRPEMMSQMMEIPASVLVDGSCGDSQVLPGFHQPASAYIGFHRFSQGLHPDCRLYEGSRCHRRATGRFVTLMGYICIDDTIELIYALSDNQDMGYLTQREKEILGFLKEGKKVMEIASHFGVETSSISRSISNVRHKVMEIEDDLVFLREVGFLEVEGDEIRFISRDPKDLRPRP